MARTDAHRNTRSPEPKPPSGPERTVRKSRVIPFVALVACVAALFAFPRSMALNDPRPRAEQLACANNLREMGVFLIERATSHRKGRPPASSFFLQTIEGTAEHPRYNVFDFCPADPGRAPAGARAPGLKLRVVHGQPPGAGLASYVVRDFARCPLPSSSRGREPLALCPWHKDGVNVLFDDCSITILRWEQLGMAPGEPLVTGPAAGNELLRMFRPVGR